MLNFIRVFTGLLFILSMGFFLKAGLMIRRLMAGGVIQKFISSKEVPAVNTLILVAVAILQVTILCILLAVMGKLFQSRKR